MKDGKLLVSGEVNNIINMAKGKVFESNIQNDKYSKLRKKNIIIDEKHNGTKVHTRYIGENIGGIEVSPKLEDSYMYLTNME